RALRHTRAPILPYTTLFRSLLLRRAPGDLGCVLAVRGRVSLLARDLDRRRELVDGVLHAGELVLAVLASAVQGIRRGQLAALAGDRLAAIELVGQLADLAVPRVRAA